MNHVYVVIDSQHTIVGVFATHTQDVVVLTDLDEVDAFVGSLK